MNEKFFSLPEEKRQRIINGGFAVFSENSYQKSSMNEIAQQAQISKSLLFFYFRNKRELYLYLWKEACRLTLEYLNAYHCYEPTDLFEMMERGMNAKMDLMEEYPYIANFAIRAFYEIHASYQEIFHRKAGFALARVNREVFRPGLDLSMMYRQMFLASEGYLWEMLQQGGPDRERMRRDFVQLLEFWKTTYLREDKR